MFTGIKDDFVIIYYGRNIAYSIILGKIDAGTAVAQLFMLIDA